MITINKLQSLSFKALVTFVFAVLFSTSYSFAQESTTPATDEGNKPVSGAFNSGIFLENQTTLMYPKKTVEVVINHRFGKIATDGVGNFKDLFGIYAPSNIRMGINYSVTNKLQLGIGTTKYNKQQDFNAKYGIFEQTTNNAFPVSVTAFASIYYDAREKATSFDYANFSESHRFSYFSELLISRKFNDFLTIQVAPTWAHFNVTESASDTSSVRLRRNDQFGLSVVAKIKCSETIALFCEFDKNLTPYYRKDAKINEPKPNLAIGIENSTAAHSFQLFITTAEAITYQHNMVYNTNDFLHSGFMFGFNITRVFYK
ncbi:MAG: DUF5777 family beta-barrel protein [Bacteroidetes bacterium]|nr:DUF5777 family beta-barrel protein [Bacteroidota bacterium]